ncbi:MAG: Re/Si-specific NAD(P)(+) transhydrogenase subunit alpha [Rickettsiaceae bacterium]|nr:Re/Si-specific NAD(P)(+) transhydrogenase subunit alpha [Rickettsiaceae bacterium]
MKIAVLKERVKGELRVALTPEIVKAYVRDGYSVFCEKSAGIAAGYTDDEYKAAGATISSVPLEIVSDADIILKVQPSPTSDEINELAFAKEKAIIIGLLSPFANVKLIHKYAEKNITSLAMELVPRTTKAQVMDCLSSQSNLAGYRAVIEASNAFGKAFPMMMTSAGTISPAKVLVLGAGVAGLQAIATAKRLGAVVFAYDVRAAAKEQVESVGGRFIAVGASGDFSNDSGYAREVTSDYEEQQKLLLAEHSAKSDIIITTAQIPGKPAPILITADMIKKMRPGSVIVDMSTSTGGNVEGSTKDEVVKKGEVTIVGYSNLASKIAHDASKLYAKNLYNFVSHAVKGGKLNTTDEIVKAMLLTHNGKVI